jgi:hypothetical protein
MKNNRNPKWIAIVRTCNAEICALSAPYLRNQRAMYCDETIKKGLQPEAFSFKEK